MVFYAESTSLDITAGLGGTLAIVHVLHGKYRRMVLKYHLNAHLTCHRPVLSIKAATSTIQCKSTWEVQALTPHNPCSDNWTTNTNIKFLLACCCSLVAFLNTICASAEQKPVPKYFPGQVYPGSKLRLIFVCYRCYTRALESHERRSFFGQRP